MVAYRKHIKLIVSFLLKNFSLTQLKFFLDTERWVNDNNEEPGIVGIPYTPKQLFWISFAQVKFFHLCSMYLFILNKKYFKVWCFKYRDESLKHAIRTGTHAPGEYRVTGSISNNVDFSKDFKCPLGSKMNPVEKCSVW